MSKHGKEVDFPPGIPDPRTRNFVGDRDGRGATPWLKSLRSNRAFDALKAASLVHANQKEASAVIERIPTFVKAAPLELPEPCTGEDALIATASNCLAQLSANEDCALAGIDPEGVHQMRVALRRLDASLALYAPLIPRAQQKKLEGVIRSVAQTLGPARDWDVFIGDMLGPVATNMPNDPDLKLLRTIALRKRMAAYRAMRRTVRSQAYGEMWKDVVAWLTGCEWRGQPLSEKSVHLMTDVRPFSQAVLDKAHRKLLKRGKGFAVLDARERHKLRIRIKKVRYAAEFFRPLYRDERSETYLRALRAMQEDLGRLNDVECARGLIEGLEKGEGRTRASYRPCRRLGFRMAQACGGAPRGTAGSPLARTQEG